MVEMPTQMGYDRAITIFSPDGRLLQVEYARKTVAQGTTAIGMVCKEGVVLVTDKRIIEKLVVPKSIEKIYQIDDHIGATMSGLISDGRVLVEKARVEAQKHRIMYGEPIDILTIVKNICDYMQFYTQYGGTRPFGVSLLIAGVDNGRARLFMTELLGVYFEYKACSIGEGAEMVTKILESKYKDNMLIDETINLGIHALKEVLGSKFKKERVEIAVIELKTKKFRKYARQEIDKFLK